MYEKVKFRENCMKSFLLHYSNNIVYQLIPQEFFENAIHVYKTVQSPLESAIRAARSQRLRNGSYAEFYAIHGENTAKCTSSTKLKSSSPEIDELAWLCARRPRSCTRGEHMYVRTYVPSAEFRAPGGLSQEKTVVG